MAPRLSSCIRLLLASLLAQGAAAESLKRGAFGEPESLDPNRSGVISEQLIVMDLFEGLTTFGPRGEVVPGAAKSWSASEDGLSYRFSLRPDLRWSDGSSLTAADFVYSFRRTMSPATQSTRAHRLAVLRNGPAVLRGELAATALGITAPDPNTVTIQLQHPVPRLPLLLAYSEAFPLPRHAIESHGESWKLPGQMVSNGPYRLVERRPQEYVKLQANPFYHSAGQVEVKAIVYYPSDSLDSAVSRFRAGELHVNGWPGFPPRQQSFLKEQLGAAVRVTPLLNVAYLRFNLERPALADVRVRQALSLAINRVALAQRVLGGGEQPALNLVPPQVSSYEGAAPHLDYSLALDQRLEKAAALLAAAGYSQSQPVELTLRYPTGQGREICVAVQAMWRPLPVQVTLENSEIKSMIVDLRRGNFDLALTGALDGDDPERFLDRLLPDSSYNTGSYKDPAFALLMSNAKQEPDPERRSALLREAEHVALTAVPVIPLYYGVSRALVSNRIAGFFDNPADVHLSRYLSLKPVTALR